jgi:DNA-binding MarR family transcriptional regulator
MIVSIIDFFHYNVGTMTTAATVAESAKTSGKQERLRGVAKAMWALLASGKPRFPMVAQEFGLTPPQLHILRLLTENETLPMGELAGLLFCDASNVTVLVDRLEERGLIERRTDPADRRVRLIALTPEGVELRSQVLEKLYVPPDGIAALPKADQRELLRILNDAVELQAAATGLKLAR